MSRPQNSCSPIGHQKVKNYPNIMSKSDVKIQEIIENESYSTTLADQKQVSNPMLTQKIAP